MPIAYIALGSNLSGPAGPPDRTLAAAVERLASSGRIVARASLYSTAPVGYLQQPRFLNTVIALETKAGPRELLLVLMSIEREFGRDRSNAISNGPRSLDLDIVMYGDLMVTEAGLELPHPRFSEREFVLVPLNEIAPDLRDPRSGQKVQELLQQLRAGLPPEPDRTSNEVVAIESDCWRAGLAYADSGDDVSCAGTGANPGHD